MNRIKISMAAALAAGLFLLTPLLPAQEAPQSGTDEATASEADFEAALFGGDGFPEAAGGGPIAGGAAGTAGPTAVSAEVARTEYLVGGTVVVKADAASPDPYESYTTKAGVSGKVFAKVSDPDFGALYVAYNISHPFFQGYSGDGQAPAAADPYEPDYELSELHYSFDIAKKVFVRLGNQLIAWGPSRIWTPVDFINLQRADPFAELDARRGKPGLRVHVPLKRGNFFGFADFGSTSADGAYGDPAETVNLAGRADFTAAGFEFGATVYGGAEAEPRFGADFSGRLLGTTVYGEYALTTETDGAEPSVQASAGFTRALGELKRWTVSAEGFFNSRGSDRTGLSALELAILPADERPAPLYEGVRYVNASIQADELFSPDLTTALSVTANLTDFSYLAKLSETVALPRAVPFTFALSYAGGGADKEFTRYAGDGALAASLSVRIEF